MQPWHFRSATSLAADIRAGSISARDLLEHFIARIDRLNPAINAIVVQDREAARFAADAADAAVRTRSAALGPLHGVTITVKEQFDWRGFPSTFGVPALKDHRADTDALAVQRLKNAGAIVLGKTNTPYAGSDLQTYNDIYGLTENPWRLGRTPGGSSGGSAAALAAGFSALELGSDIGGSIRNPAHSCGIFGHKPTFGLAPTRGHATRNALSPMDLVVIGPLARSADDLDLALSLIGQPDAIEATGIRNELPPLSEPTTNLRIAVWADDPLCPVSGAVRDRMQAVCATLSAQGARIDRQARPDFDAATVHRLYVDLLDAATVSGIPDAAFSRMRARAAELPADDDSALARITRNQTMDHRRWLHLHEQRTQASHVWHRFFAGHDFLLAPIMPIPAFPHDHRPFGQRKLCVDGVFRPYLDVLFWAGLPTLCGLPSTVIPAGITPDGLPVGIQIIGPAYGDRRTIGLARRLEQLGFGFSPPPAIVAQDAAS